MMILYRTVFVSNLFDAMRCIKKGLLHVEGFPVTSYHFYIGLTKMIHFDLYYTRRIKKSLWIRAYGRSFIYSAPTFLYVNYIYIVAFLLRYPVRQDFVYPIAIDIQRLVGYY